MRLSSFVSMRCTRSKFTKCSIRSPARSRFSRSMRLTINSSTHSTRQNPTKIWMQARYPRRWRIYPTERNLRGLRCPSTTSHASSWMKNSLHPVLLIWIKILKRRTKIICPRSYTVKIKIMITMICTNLLKITTILRRQLIGDNLI